MTLHTDTTDNVVFLRGRLAAAPSVLTLPSGDELCAFRIIVARPLGEAGRSKVDTVDCRVSTARARRVVERAEPGVELELHGSLRRRFWRGGGGVQSRYEVEVTLAKKLRTDRGQRVALKSPRTGA